MNSQSQYEKQLNDLPDLSWNYSALQRKSHDPNRLPIVKKIISEVSGIYRDKAKAKEFGIEMHVLVNVISYHKESTGARYFNLLENWFCFASHFGLRPLTYLVPNEDFTFEETVRDLIKLGFHGDFAPYPTELFWSIVSKKRTEVKSGFGKSDFGGIIPSFSRFGALVMLVPLLEVLELGYSVIYIDLDVAFVHDPIPGLIRGNADISLSLEMKTCICPSVLSVAMNTQWSELEPNTGIMHIRATKPTLSLIHRWFQRIVDENCSNDQKVLKLKDYGGNIDFSCNEYLSKHEKSLKPVYNKFLSQHGYHYIPDETLINSNEIIRNVTFCFLNEYEFQNGKVGLQCSKNVGGSVHEYILGVVEQNFTHGNKEGDLPTMTPRIIHANYCDDKISEFKNLGLWLSNHDQFTIKSNNNTYDQPLICNNYLFNETSYAKTNWNDKILKANNELNKMKPLLKNGTVLKLHKWPTIYLCMDNTLRPFPNGETFIKMGYGWKDVKYPGPFNLFKTLPIGNLIMIILCYLFLI